MTCRLGFESFDRVPMGKAQIGWLSQQVHDSSQPTTGLVISSAFRKSVFGHAYLHRQAWHLKLQPLRSCLYLTLVSRCSRCQVTQQRPLSPSRLSQRRNCACAIVTQYVKCDNYSRDGRERRNHQFGRSGLWISVVSSRLHVSACCRKL